MNNKSNLVAIIGIMAIAGLGLYSTFKDRKSKSRLDKIAEDLSKKTDVEVSDELIKLAAEKAANNAGEIAIKKVREDIEKAVHDEVIKCYEETVNNVSKDFIEKVEAEISVDDVKKAVENKAANVLMKKFTEKMEEYSKLHDFFKDGATFYRI